MSKRETPMTRAYWELVGGTLIEEFCAVRRRKDRGGRWLDGLIIPDGPRKRFARRPPADLTLDGRDVVVVQTKARRLGMYLMGQALFSPELVRKHFEPRSVRTVALCTKDDAVLRPLAEAHGIEVVVMDRKTLALH